MLKSLAVRYDPPEDRLILELVVARADRSEARHRLHLTRRVCAAWRQDLQAMADLSAEAPPQLDAPVRAAVPQAHHQAMAESVGIRTEKPPATPPPADPPALVTNIACGRRRGTGGARWMIRFDIRDQPALQLALSDRTLHGLIAALSRRVQAIGWALPPLPSESAAATPPRPNPAAAGFH